MAEVRIRDLRKNYGSLEVIHGVEFDISDGEFVVLVGPSGCGKSTLLRMIAGLEGITSGSISIGDRVVNNLPPSKRDIAMVFQNYALYPHKTVGANMAFSLKMAGMPKDEIQDRVRRAAEILGLTEYLNRYPRALSGGQRQRVAMGRAIVRDPQVFLFDEPLSNLDAKLRGHLRVEIARLHKALKSTSIYVTHDQLEAMTLADRIVLMNQGRIEQMGTPEEIYSRPATLFAAGFIGTPNMNFMQFDVENGALRDGLIHLPAPVGAPAQVTLGIRPGSVEVLPEEAEGTLRATVERDEFHGETRLVALQCGTHSLMASVPAHMPLREGQELYIRLPEDKLHYFDTQTGQRLD